MSDTEMHDESYWLEKLTPEEYRICRQKGTERPFTGKYWNEFGAGIYLCVGCGQTVFESDTKFDAGCGWPSFYAPAAKAVIKEAYDTTHGMHRTEVLCQGCGSHLGHVFNDGPAPTGLRYCINSASLSMEKKSTTNK